MKALLKNWPENVIWPVTAVLSLALHAMTGGVISSAALTETTKSQPVKVKIVEVKKEEPIQEEPAPPPPPPPPEKKKPPKKPEPKKVASERQPPKDREPQPNAKPIQGLDKNSFDSSGKSSISAPLGNTLLTEDTGERVNEAPPPLPAADLSADAKLIMDSFVIPQYTDAALDASYEGIAIVEVFVDETGAVKEAELKKKIGYGMDQRILDVAYNARFIPRKNKLGASVAGWTQIRFNLQIP